MKIALRLFAGLICGFLSIGASAQDYPVRPVRVIFPWAGGSSTNDILGRALMQRLSVMLGQQMVVDNRPGANGNIGSELAAKSSPDGHTLLLGYTGAQAISPSVYPRLGYDPIEDLAPVIRFASFPFVMVVHPDVPANNIQELIALAKSRPAQLNFASTGTGSMSQLAAEIFKVKAQINIVHVPYKGGALATNDILAGHVQIYFAGPPNMVPYVKTGRLRAIAVTSLDRLSLIPDVPTLNESGYPGFDVSTWIGVMAPAKTPPAIIKRLYEAIAKIVDTSEMKSFIASQGGEAETMDPAKFGATLKSEIATWAPVVKALNLNP